MNRFGQQRRGDSGYTLVEMLVTVVVFTLVMGSITGVIITSLKHQNSLQDRDKALANVRNAIENVDRDIRSANPLCYGTGTEVSMLETDPSAGVSNATVIVDYKVINGTSLQYTRYATNGTSASTTLTTPAATPISCTWTQPNGTTVSTSTLYAGTQLVRRTVISNLVGTAASPVFLQATAPTTTTAGYDSCPATGTTGGGTTLNYPAVATAVQAITVNVAAQPSTLSHPVLASDCGTYLNNYVNPL
jgi:prepilin-type N-terminal cleavage/methylation domain-containing protein